MRKNFSLRVTEHQNRLHRDVVREMLPGDEGDGVSFSADTQNPPGHSPVQSALGEPALAWDCSR